MALPPEVAASYSSIIDSILTVSDLNTISAKRIRKGLQAAVNYDISPQKDAINELIHARFDKFNNARADTAADVAPASSSPPLPPKSPPTVKSPPQQAVNGAVAAAVETKSAASPTPKESSPSYSSSSAKRETESEDEEVARPPKKKPKTSETTEKDDAAFAARLQAEENSRARPTRGSAQKKRPLVRKTNGEKKKKKSAKKVKATDDSDIESGSGGEEKPKKGAFHKPFLLSEPLAELLGETTLSRPQTVKRIWEYVKEHELQDPSDKRQIRCDPPLRAIFKQDSVHMFTMNKILSHNLYPAEE